MADWEMHKIIPVQIAAVSFISNPPGLEVIETIGYFSRNGNSHARTGGSNIPGTSIIGSRINRKGKPVFVTLQSSLKLSFFRV
jgi:hypothetical protein